MTVLGDANTLLSWSAATMAADGVDTSSVSALLPAQNLQALVAIRATLTAIEDQVRTEITAAWHPTWAAAQEQVWSEMPTLDLDAIIDADARGRGVVKRVMRLTSAVRCRRLATG